MNKKTWKRPILAAIGVVSLVASPRDANAVDFSKMSTRLAGVLNADYRAPGQSVDTIKATMQFLGQIQGWLGEEPDRFYVYIHVDPAFPVAALPGYVEVVNQREDWKLVAGWLAESDLAALSDEPSVDYIRCVDPPRHRKQGIIDTQGNAIHNANNARSNKGIDGVPIKVGVVSDGVTNRVPVGGTNDLPGIIDLPQGAGSGDEGTAMLEIIHDLAPGSPLAFCPSGTNIIAFANAVTALVQMSNCRIVCDDVGWYSEPYFYHGYVAQALQNLGAGTSYLHVSAAGNDAAVHHQQVYTDTSPANGEHDPLLQATLPPGGVLEVWLQWNDVVGNYGDYDLFIEDSSGTALTPKNQNMGGYPGEYVVYINQTGSTQTVDAVIKYFSGNASRTLEVFFELWNGAAITAASQPNFSGTDAIFGQAALPGVVAVGAVNQASPAVIESFSSQGPVSHTGTPQINKPDVVGVDNVTVSVGVTAPWSGFSTSFSGTSAAAPHIAGLLALAWSYSPGVMPSGVVSAMKTTAANLGAPGFDVIFGNGLPDADATAGALNRPPALTSPPTTINATQKVGKPVVGLSVSDPDVGAGNLTLTFTASNGTITVDDTVTNGVILTDITGNGTSNVTVTATASKINNTLASPDGVIYLGNGGFLGSQSMNLVLSDNGNSGYGGTLATGGAVQLLLHNNAYETWSRDRFGTDVDDPGKEPTIWGLVANPDNDTYPNQWEFFIGADPKSADASGVFLPSISGTNFIYTFRVSNDIDSNAYDVRYSTDLSSWTGVPSGQWTKTPHPTVPDATEVTITRPLNTREFLRIWFEPDYQVP